MVLIRSGNRELTVRAVTKNAEMREMLFGDVPLASWASHVVGEGADRLEVARAAEEAGNTVEALAVLSSIVETPHLPSRHLLEAWSALRAGGVEPPATIARHVLGVVLDVPVAGGLDTLAVYDDGTVRYLNHTGAAAVVQPDATWLRPHVDEVLGRGRHLADLLAPWHGPRPELPDGVARVSVLCPSGLCLGQGPAERYLTDALAAPVFEAGASLLVSLIKATS